MTKQLSLVFLIFILAAYGFAVAVAHLNFQVISFRYDRDLAMTAYMISIAVQIITAPLLMRLSDSIGRNAILQISFVGVLIALVNLLFATSAPQLMVSQVIVGLTTTGLGCFNAYISDQNSKHRAEVFAIASAVWSLTFVGALTVQDELHQFDQNLSVYAGILVTLAGMALIQFVLPKSLDESNKTSFNILEGSVIGSIRALFSTRVMGLLTVVMALYYLGARAYVNVQFQFLGIRHGNPRAMVIVIGMQQLFAVILAIFVFALILALGRNKTIVVTMIVGIVGMASISYIPIQMERYAIFFPYVANIAGFVFLAMVADRTSPNRYGLLFGGVTVLTVLMELVAAQSPSIFEYLRDTSPQYIFLCVVIPAMILLLGLMVFLSIPKQERV